MKLKPIYVYSRYIPFGRFDYVTLLLWIVIKKKYNPATGKWEKPKMSERAKRHEYAHVYQQVCLFALGLFGLVFVLTFGSAHWATWTLPVLLPFILYGLCWLAELILPPFKTAYKDVCFEREARAYDNHETELYPFSFLKFILRKDER